MGIQCISQKKYEVNHGNESRIGCVWIVGINVAEIMEPRGSSYCFLRNNCMPYGPPQY